jgi:hypothetical protein
LGCLCGDGYYRRYGQNCCFGCICAALYSVTWDGHTFWRFSLCATPAHWNGQTAAPDMRWGFIRPQIQFFDQVRDKAASNHANLAIFIKIFRLFFLKRNSKSPITQPVVLRGWLNVRRVISWCVGLTFGDWLTECLQ